MKSFFAEADFFPNAEQPLPMAAKERVHLPQHFRVHQKLHERMLFRSGTLTRTNQ
jgi:hypothetical protein